MAIPKSLKKISNEQAERLIARHLKNGTGYWEDVYSAQNPYTSGDFLYGAKPLEERWMIRRDVFGTIVSYERGKISM